MARAGEVVRVEMVADVVCPFCYIGLERLKRGIDAVAGRGLPLSVEVSYTPFILRRQLPKEGVDKLSVFARQFGSESLARQKLNSVKQAAASDGLCFDMEGQRAGNSEDAHRLLLWAQSLGKDIELFESMVRAYNCERGWLGDHDVLTKAVARAGLPVDEASAVLADAGARLDALESGLQRSSSLGVSGVPFFVVEGPAGRRAMSGAVPAEDFVRVFEDAAQGKL